MKKKIIIIIATLIILIPVLIVGISYINEKIFYYNGFDKALFSQLPTDYTTELNGVCLIQEDLYCSINNTPNDTIELNRRADYHTYYGYMYINVNQDTTVILNGINICSNNTPALVINSNGNHITLIIKDNTLNSFIDNTSRKDEDLNSAVIINGPCSVSGNGTLKITGNYNHGLVFYNNTTISSGHFDIISKNKDAIQSKENLTINDGSFSLQAASDGIESKQDLIINDGIINITNCYEGIEAKGRMFLNGGNHSIVTEEDSINAHQYLEVTGGTFYVKSHSEDTIDVNCAINITGGTLLLIANESGIDAEETTPEMHYFDFNFTGGLIVALGVHNNFPNVEGSADYITSKISNDYINTKLVYSTVDNDVICAITVTRNYNRLLLCYPNMFKDGNKIYMYPEAITYDTIKVNEFEYSGTCFPTNDYTVTLVK